jgi:hypothetical protein
MAVLREQKLTDFKALAIFALAGSLLNAGKKSGHLNFTSAFAPLRYKAIECKHCAAALPVEMKMTDQPERRLCIPGTPEEQYISVNVPHFKSP